MNTQQNRNWQALVDTVRALPLETVAATLGYRRDERDRARWRQAGSVLSINGQRFFDHVNVRGGGGAIDLVMHARECSFRAAVEFLSGQAECACAASQPQLPQPRVQRPLVLPQSSTRLWPDVSDHLVEVRGLEPRLVRSAHRDGLIYADPSMNAVFVARDTEGRITGAEIVGTRRSPDQPTFKSMAPGSRKALGGFWLSQRRGAPRALLLMESAIDALSALSLSIVPDCHTVVSTAGLAARVPVWTDAWQPKTIICAYDADSAGEAAAVRLMRDDRRVVRFMPGDGDWNDMLLKARDGEATWDISFRWVRIPL